MEDNSMIWFVMAMFTLGFVGGIMFQIVYNHFQYDIREGMCNKGGNSFYPLYIENRNSCYSGCFFGSSYNYACLKQCDSLYKEI